MALGHFAWSISICFLSVIVLLSSVCCSVCTEQVRWDGNGLSGSDLDVWTSSIALLNLLMLFGGSQSFWCISMCYLSNFMLLSSVCFQYVLKRYGGTETVCLHLIGMRGHCQ